ncbi:MAG: endonuclease III [Nitrospirae bacterium RIFCSPLOWO2_02_42_7]|nr:MAG: endonuclease III [Nitrospirae bacterium GWA2_42_11]OGW53278.1 MAG: endonuclease III [Nitrospirae bacterium RIFCSPLOWO2_02_42_7]
MKDSDIHKIIKILKEDVKKWDIPVVSIVAERTRDPFKVLISCILSLRTKDGTTAQASQRLFSLADNPAEMSELSVKEIERVIYPVGFYRTKARNIKEICHTLINDYDSKVPDEIDELLKLKGVGRKTANLVVTIGYDKDGICVDTHVHRISNRWGYIKTKTPEESEMALRKKLPRRYWKIYNDLLVTFGQNLCKPISPLCSQCNLTKFCNRIGVKKSR